MSTNDVRVSHDPDRIMDYSPDENVRAALDALFTEDMGLGYCEVQYVNNVFVSVITMWDSPSKNYKQTETTITYAPSSPFVDQIQKVYYKDEGAVTVRTLTKTFTRNANKTVNTVTTVAS